MAHTAALLALPPAVPPLHLPKQVGDSTVPQPGVHAPPSHNNPQSASFSNYQMPCAHAFALTCSVLEQSKRGATKSDFGASWQSCVQDAALLSHQSSMTEEGPGYDFGAWPELSQVWQMANGGQAGGGGGSSCSSPQPSQPGQAAGVRLASVASSAAPCILI